MNDSADPDINSSSFEHRDVKALVHVEVYNINSHEFDFAFDVSREGIEANAIATISGAYAEADAFGEAGQTWTSAYTSTSQPGAVAIASAWAFG